MFILISLVQMALAGFNTGNCLNTDAPNAFFAHDCDGLCTYNSTTNAITCDIDNYCSGGVGGDLTVIGRFMTSSNEYSAWVQCNDVNNTKACCAYNEGAGEEVDIIYALGSEENDDIHFHFSDVNTTEDLKPTANRDLIGVMDGEGDGDGLFGSDYAQNDYREFIHGNGGWDYIYGGDGGDRIWGGTGDDNIYGADGPDKMIGGAGNDYLWGQEGDDVLCDDTGPIGYCASDDGNALMGGEGDDFLWYPKVAGCFGTLEPSYSEASPSTTEATDLYDYCGNDADWTETIFLDWPNYCDIPTNTAHNFCSNAWPY